MVRADFLHFQTPFDFTRRTGSTGGVWYALRSPEHKVAAVRLTRWSPTALKNQSEEENLVTPKKKGGGGLLRAQQAEEKNPNIWKFCPATR